VKAKPFLDILTKLAEDEVDVGCADGEIRVKGKGRRAGVTMDADVLLPVEAVEKPGDWKALPDDFCQAISLVYGCASLEESRFVLTCVHFSASFVEACDGFQLARFPFLTGFENSTLVRAESMRRVIGMDMKEMSETQSWLHFRNSSGLEVSVRRYLDEYPNLEKFLDSAGLTPFTMPGGLEEAVQKAEVFSQDGASGNYVLVDLRDSCMLLEGRSVVGWFQEKTKHALPSRERVKRHLKQRRPSFSFEKDSRQFG
jgi:hypothetical protein